MTHEFAYPRVRQIAPRAHGVSAQWRTARPTTTSDASPSRTPPSEAPALARGRLVTAASRR